MSITLYWQDDAVRLFATLPTVEVAASVARGLDVQFWTCDDASQIGALAGRLARGNRWFDNLLWLEPVEQPNECKGALVVVKIARNGHWFRGRLREGDLSDAFVTCQAEPRLDGHWPTSSVFTVQGERAS